MLRIVKTKNGNLIVNVTHVDYIAGYQGGVIIKFTSGEWERLDSISTEEVFQQLKPTTRKGVKIK